MSEPPAKSDGPKRSVFLSARWSQLLMVNFVIDPGLLRGYVPRGTELDEHGGRCFVSIVGFLFEDTRLAGWRIPGYQCFEEVNLRFYVRRPMPDGDRRGVVFIKEIVPHRITAWMARWFYNENYVAHPMQHQLDGPEHTSRRVEYRWQDKQPWNTIAATIQGDPRPSQPGSETEFITEHYWGYVTQRDGRCVEYAVEHPRWRVFDPIEVTLDVDFSTTYGSVWAEALSEPPHSTFVAEGSPVVVRRGVRI